MEMLTEVVSAIVRNLSLPDLSLVANVLSLWRQVEGVAKFGCIGLCSEESEEERMNARTCCKVTVGPATEHITVE